MKSTAGLLSRAGQVACLKRKSVADPKLAHWTRPFLRSSSGTAGGEIDIPNDLRRSGATRRPLLSTFRQEHLTRAAFIDLSQVKMPELETISHRKSRIYYHRKQSSGCIPFPPRSRGFFYFHRPSFAPQFAGGLRFRIVPSGDPADFDSGTDLRDHEGIMPYQIDTLRIIALPRWQPLMDVLENDGLVSARVIRDVKELYCSMSQSSMQWPALYAFRQPFYLNFARHTRVFRLLTYEHDVLVKRSVQVAFPGWSYYARHLKGPYTGSIIACFEQVPEDNTVAIKVLKIVEPIKYTDNGQARLYQEPKKGEYLAGVYNKWGVNYINSEFGLAQLRFLREYPGVISRMFEYGY